MQNFIPVAKPWLDQEEADAAARPILSGWVTQGPEVEAFEQEFADYTGAEYACAVSSCTAALHLALLAVGVKPGDEVITVSHSFIATANSIRYCNAKPVFVDVDLATFNIMPDLIAAAVNDRTAALLVVHQMGMPADMKKILAVAGKYNLPVVEDAACAAGSEININGTWEKIGKPHGDVACFSFHPRKILTTGDGGMLTTRNPEYDNQFKLLRQHGMQVPDSVRHTSPKVIFENYAVHGFNYRMTDIQAAVGRVQLLKLDTMVAQRRQQADIYRNGFRDLDGIILPFEPDYAKSNYQSYCIRLPDRIDQREFMQYLLDHNIASRRGIMCAHCEPPFSDTGYDLPASVKGRDSGVILPLFQTMTEEEFQYVIDTTVKFFRLNP